MAIPILQTITPGAAFRGLSVELTGFHFDGGQVVLQLGAGSPITVTPEIAEARRIVFLVPFSAELGKNSIVVRNGDGDSNQRDLPITEDQLLGFQICLPPKTAEEYREQAIQLQPEGRAWSIDPESRWQKLLGSAVEEIARVRERACELRTEQQPTKTVDLLPEHETELGLPEPCNLYAPQNFEERRNEVIRKAYSVGGNTAAYFRGLAALMGLDVVITEDTGTEVFLAGRNRAGDRVNGTIWLFTWYIEVQEYTINVFRAGQNVSGTPIRWWGAEEIECYFNRLKPAHTNLVITFADNDWICVPDSGEIIISNESEGDIIVSVQEI
jgi:uncharacterized protein YmfQ (DUF2313 family)